MAIRSEHNYERVSPTLRIGTIEHLETYTQKAAESSIETVKQLQEFLQAYDIPESLANFIFNYQTRQNRKYWVPEKTSVIDTRGLIGYKPSWPSLHAEYHYDPPIDRNYVNISSRPYPFEEPESNYSYHLYIPLTNAVELDMLGPLEAHINRGDPAKLLEIHSFRSYSSSDARYAEVRNPGLFIGVLQKITEELKQNLTLRDY